MYLASHFLPEGTSVSSTPPNPIPTKPKREKGWGWLSFIKLGLVLTVLIGMVVAVAYYSQVRAPNNMRHYVLHHYPNAQELTVSCPPDANRDGDFRCDATFKVDGKAKHADANCTGGLSLSIMKAMGEVAGNVCENAICVADVNK